MRDMIVKLQDGYKNTAMHVNPKKNDAWKKIGQTKIFITISINRETGSIDWKSGIISFFEKTEHFNAETPQSTLYYE